MKDLTCPYCGHKQDAVDIHEEDCTHQVECGKCEKIYGVMTEYFPSYTISEMPCANGEDHKWKKIVSTSPVMNGMGRWRCEYCDEEKLFSAECAKDCKKDKTECWQCGEVKS